MVYFIFFTIHTAPLLCLCALLGSWLVLGRMHLFIRMPVFLLGNLALGLVLCFEFLDFGWIVRSALATSFVACFVGTLRLFGFRLVALTDGVSRREMEKATGHDLDEWIAILDDADAQSLNHAEIMAILRRYGIDFSWQKAVTLAYKRALGRHNLAEISGEQLQVVQEMPADWLSWLTQSPKQQFAIWQMMSGTFCAASLLAYVRAFGGYAPTTEDFSYGIPITVGVATVALPTLLGCLAIRDVWRKNAVALVVSLATAAGVLHVMGFRSNNFGYSAFFATVPAFAGLLMACLMLVRHRGYRLVRVQRTDRSRQTGCNDRTDWPIRNRLCMRCRFNHGWGYMLTHPASKASSKTSSST